MRLYRLGVKSLWGRLSNLQLALILLSVYHKKSEAIVNLNFIPFASKQGSARLFQVSA